MDPIFNQNNTIEAIEIIRFDEAEIEKVKGDNISFAAIGALSVLYLKDYKRFMLQINDWKYPLLRRLPIMCMDKTDMTNRLYCLPTLNGFSFNLRLKNCMGTEGLRNFENIMLENSGFYFKGEEQAFRKMEGSPDDKLMRQMKKDTGLMEKMEETVKMGMEKMKIAGKSLKDGTKHIDSKKHKVLLKDIKNRNYRRMAHATLKKDMLLKNEKMTQEIFMMRKQNSAHLKSMNCDELKKMNNLPILYLPREDIEECILLNKDIASLGKFHMGDLPKRDMMNINKEIKMEEKKGFMDSLKKGLTDLKDNLTGRVQKIEQNMDQKMMGMENMTHYQG